MARISNEEGFDIAVGVSRGILRLLGIWPSIKEENWVTRHYFLVPAFVMFYFCNVSQTIELTKVWGDFNAVLEVLTTSNVSIVIALFKMLGLRYNRKGQLVISISKDWKNIKTDSEYKTMWKITKLSRLMSVIIISLAEGTILVYFTLSLLLTVTEAKIWNSMEFKTNFTRTRPMYLKAEFLFNTQNSPYYMIIWIFQCLSTLFAASAFSSIDAFFASLVLHLCGQLTNVKEELKNLPRKIRTRKDQNFINQFSALVQRHEELRRFAITIENSFNIIFLVQLVASSLMLILQGYQLVKIITSTDKISILELTFMIYFTLCFTFSIFVYCYVADVLRGESMGIGDAVYESEWYELAPTKRKLLILVIMRTKEPFEITAGKFAALSLQLFCRILKSSGSYVSMLLAVQDRLIT